MKLITKTVLLLAAVVFFQGTAARAQDHSILREYIDVNGNTVASRVVILNKQTGSKRVLTTVNENANVSGIVDAAYNPQNNTVEVSKYEGGNNQKTILETYDYDTGKLLSRRTVGSQTGQTGPRSYLGDTVYTFPPDLSQDVSNLNSRVDNLDKRVDKLDTRVNKLSDKIDKVGALAAALEVERPIDGKLYRIGADLGFFNDEAALGVSFSTIKGSWDGGAGVAFASGETMGKVSAGFNW